MPRIKSNPPPAQPPLLTTRLRLRPFALADAPAVARLAGDRAIADTMISIPHPFTVAMARDWIRRQTAGCRHAEVYYWAISHRGRLVGAIGLRDIDWEHSKAELSFWVGRPHWGKGYVSEVVPPVLEFAFATLGLNRIVAHHMTRNPASGKVLEKAGFQREGLLREDVRKWGRFEDVVVQALLRRDWNPAITH